MKGFRFFLIVAVVILSIAPLVASNTNPAPTGSAAVMTGTASSIDLGAKKFTLTRDDGGTSSVSWNARTKMSGPPQDGDKVKVLYSNAGSARSRTAYPTAVVAENISVVP